MRTNIEYRIPTSAHLCKQKACVVQHAKYNQFDVSVYSSTLLCDGGAAVAMNRW